jgi:hypothetical protein
MPANSLASVCGLIDDCAQRQILGPETDIEIILIDEANTRVRIDRIISDMRANNNFGFVGLVGFNRISARVRCISRSLCARQVSRTSAVFMSPACWRCSIKSALTYRPRSTWALRCLRAKLRVASTKFLHDAAQDALKPIYNYINDLPALEHAVIPFLPGNHQRITAQMASARSELWRRSGQWRVPKGQRRFPDVALPRP